MSELRQAVRDTVRAGVQHRERPFRLASGQFSHWYLDAKQALAAGAALRRACQAMIELAGREGVEFDAAGGLTLGADAYATGIAIEADKRWFVVRKQAKDHGRGRRIEAGPLGPGVRVLLVDDVVTTGGSMLDALEQVLATGATVVLATALVDRGRTAAKEFANRGIRYRPLLTFEDLGIPAIGEEPGWQTETPL